MDMNTDSESAEDSSTRLEPCFDRPVSTDGARLHHLIASCPPLDPNSVYCNLLQCSHFAATSIKVESADDGELLGFVSGYIPPGLDNVLFVWQVAVSGRARGMNLGVRMIRGILERPECAGVNTVNTTITPDNAASWGLFKKLARELKCDYRSEVLFSRDDHFGGSHDDEVLVMIGPFASQAS
jgi:L-2,4-diaminobutyric acid acetyltransferase